MPWCFRLFGIWSTDPAATHAGVAPPNNKVSAADYAIGLQRQQLRHRRWGTLQPAFSSLARGRDWWHHRAVTGTALKYRQMLEKPVPLTASDGRDWSISLYGCSKCLVNVISVLIEAGIIRRRSPIPYRSNSYQRWQDR